MLMIAGVDVRTAQHRLGHSDPRLTLGIDAHVVPEADREAAETLGAILARDVSPTYRGQTWKASTGSAQSSRATNARWMLTDTERADGGNRP
jgi:hypothetical protein